MNEPENVRQRYQRRQMQYDPLDQWVCCVRQSVDRAIALQLRRAGMLPVAGKRFLEVGCGTGSNLLHFLRLGFLPELLVGNELIAERVRAARHVLPAALEIVEGDAMALPYAPGSFDIVFQSMVFSSLLDHGFRRRLATKMWDWVRPGGGVLWYDFVYDNPRNPDVRGVRLAEVAELFPHASINTVRVTLAPPIGRRVARHQALYRFLELVPFLRTHVLCWIAKSN